MSLSGSAIRLRNLPESVRSATEKRSGYKYGQEVDGVA